MNQRFDLRTLFLVVLAVAIVARYHGQMLALGFALLPYLHIHFIISTLVVVGIFFLASWYLFRNCTHRSSFRGWLVVTVSCLPLTLCVLARYQWSLLASQDVQRELPEADVLVLNCVFGLTTLMSSLLLGLVAGRVVASTRIEQDSS